MVIWFDGHKSTCASNSNKTQNFLTMLDEEKPECGKNTRQNRRKKKNARFLRNAKGFGKKGIFGRGAEIKDDQYHYFISILDTMKAGFESAEEKVNMANNVFELTKEEEVHLASNQIVSKVLESLIGFVDDEHLERFFVKFSDTFRPICSNPFASHVLQKMVEVAFLRSVDKPLNEVEGTNEGPTAKRTKTDNCCEETYNLEMKCSQKHKDACGNFVMRVSKFLLNNLEDFVWDSCANHIIRTCVLCLAGIYEPKVAFKKSSGCMDMTKNKIFAVPIEWGSVMKEYAERLQMWPQFKDFPYQEHSSALLASICVALQQIDKSFLKHFGKKMLMESFMTTDDADLEDESQKKVNSESVIDTDDHKEIVDDKDNVEHAKVEFNMEKNIPVVFKYKSSVILLETLLATAGPKLFTQLYVMLFRGRIGVLALEQSTNFAIQRLLRCISVREDFENTFEELIVHTDELLNVGHTGVVAELAAACLRLGAKQSAIVSSLQTALHVRNKEKLKYFLGCLLKLKPYDVAMEDKSNHVNLHGSLITQTILQFNKPIVMVNCILETPADQLAVIVQTPNGSHIVDAFLQSKFVGEKSREKLIRQFEGFYVDMAITKFGSRVVENLFAASQEGQKARIAKELSEKLNMLKSSPFGQMVNKKLRIDTYALSPAQWKASLQKRENKAEELFKDIIKTQHGDS